MGESFSRYPGLRIGGGGKTGGEREGGRKGGRYGGRKRGRKGGREGGDGECDEVWVKWGMK